MPPLLHPHPAPFAVTLICVRHRTELGCCQEDKARGRNGQRTDFSSFQAAKTKPTVGECDWDIVLYKEGPIGNASLYHVREGGDAGPLRLGSATGTVSGAATPSRWSVQLHALALITTS